DEPARTAGADDRPRADQRTGRRAAARPVETRRRCGPAAGHVVRGPDAAPVRRPARGRDTGRPDVRLTAGRAPSAALMVTIVTAVPGAPLAWKGGNGGRLDRDGSTARRPL